jgi:hypothetical protein
LEFLTSFSKTLLLGVEGGISDLRCFNDASDVMMGGAAQYCQGSARDLGGFPELQKRQFVDFKARVGEVTCNKVDDDDDFRLLTFRLAGNRGFKLDSELLIRCCRAGRRGSYPLLIRNICLFTFILHSTPQPALWVPSCIISEKKGSECEEDRMNSVRKRNCTGCSYGHFLTALWKTN